MSDGDILFAPGWGLTAPVPTLPCALPLALYLDLEAWREELWLIEASQGYADCRRRTPRLIR